MKIFFFTIVAIIISVGLFVAYQVFGFNHKSIAFTLLPKSAKSVHEFYKSDGFHGDYVYLIKAEMTRVEYDKYVTDIKMPSRYASNDSDITNELTFDYANAPTWWNPPTVNESCYYEVKSNHKDITVYSNGYAYYYSVKW